MIGIDGDRRRTRRATRWVKSGLSMMTSASGCAATTASAVSRMRRKIFGSRCGMAVSPMIDSSSIGNGLQMPAAAMAWPPTPDSFTAPACCLSSACAKAAPSASPDASAATMINRQRPGRRWQRRVIHGGVLADADEKDSFAIGGRGHRIGFRDHRRAGGDGETGKPGARDILDGSRTDRGQIEAAILAGFWRLHQNAGTRRRGDASNPAQFGDAVKEIVGAFRGLHPEHIVVGDDSGLPNIEGPERGDHIDARARYRLYRGRTADSGRVRLRGPKLRALHP